MQFLHTEFRVKHLEDIHYFLGLEILREKQGFIINQRKFTLELLAEFDCSSAAVSSPLDLYSKIHVDDSPSMANPTLYRHLVGKLNYLIHTRPDLSFVVLTFSQHMQHPSESDYLAALRVLRYLRNDRSQGIFLSSYPTFTLLAFYDADWASCRKTRRSVSGCFITFGGARISWKSNKQASISL